MNPDFSFAAVRKAVAEIKERLEEFGREELVKISKSGVRPTQELWRRAGTERCKLNNKYAPCLAVSEIPVYTTESRTLDRRSRGKFNREQEVNY